MWLYSVCQHIPGVTECEQTQVESCREIVNKLGKDLNVSHLWLYTPWYFGQIAQSLHAYFPPLNRNIRIFFACLTYSCYNPPGKEVVIILSLQNTQYGKAPGPKCCTGVSNNETQTVLCFSLHSTGHNTGNNVCLLPLPGEKLSLLSPKALSGWKAFLMEGLSIWQKGTIISNPGAKPSIPDGWACVPGVWGAPGAHTQVSPRSSQGIIPGQQIEGKEMLHQAGVSQR